MFFQILLQLILLYHILINHPHQGQHSEHKVPPEIERVKSFEKNDIDNLNYDIQYSFYFPVGVHFDNYLNYCPVHKAYVDDVVHFVQGFLDSYQYGLILGILGNHSD